jgi:uncharacterized protein with NRDE domain
MVDMVYIGGFVPHSVFSHSHTYGTRSVTLVVTKSDATSSRLFPGIYPGRRNHTYGLDYGQKDTCA